jgi:hypothetical protein
MTRLGEAGQDKDDVAYAREQAKQETSPRQRDGEMHLQHLY